MGSWLLEHYKPLRTEHAKTSLHTQHHTHLTKTGCLAWTVLSCSQDSREHLQANLPNSEHTSLTLIPVKNLALQPPQVKLCNSNLEFLPVTTSTWPELPLMVGPTLIPSCGHKTTQGRRTRSPLLGLSHCSSLSGGKSTTWDLSQLFASIPAHTAQLSTSSPGPPSPACIFTPGFPCVYPLPSHFLQKGTARLILVPAPPKGLTTLGCQYCQHLPLAPKHSGPSHADP